MKRLAQIGVILLAYVGIPALAQSSVRLQVLQKGSGDPLGRVEIKIGTTKVYTDPAGEATIAVPDGEGKVELYKAEFERESIDYAKLRAKSEQKVFLLPATPSDNEIVVRGTRRPETSRKQVSVEEAVRVAPGGDPAQVPKLLTGVQSSPFQPDIIVRGSGPQDSRYYIDSWEVPFIFHRVGNISIIPDQLLSDVEFSSGGFGAQYGGATGGVVTLQTKTTQPERSSKTEFRVNVPIYSSVYHERKIDEQSAIAISGRRSYLDAILAKALPKKLDLTVVPVFGDMHIYYWQTRDDGHLKVLGLYAYDGLQLLFNSDAATAEDGKGQFKLRNAACVAGFEWKKIINKDWTLTVAPEIQRTLIDFNILGSRIKINATGPVVQAEAVRRLGGKDRLYLGVKPKLLRGKADVRAPKFDAADPFFDFEEAPQLTAVAEDVFYDLAAWAAADQTIGALTVTPGFRTFYVSTIKKSGVDPRLNVRYELDERHSLKAAVGQYSQAPEFQDTDETFGNPDLNFIRSNHYILGFESNWDERWTTDFQAFYKESYDLVRSDPIKQVTNKGSLISAGFESFVRRNLTRRLFGWLAYTYSKTRERDSAQETFRNSRYDQTHVLNLVGNYKLTGLWETGGRFIYHTGDTYTGVDGAVYNANLDKYQPRTAVGARLYNDRLPAYHEIDIFANRDILWDTWKMGLRFGIEFLALERPVQSVRNNYDYSKEEYFRGIPPIPYVEVRGTL